jgi:hypothetical protein
MRTAVAGFAVSFCLSLLALGLWAGHGAVGQDRQVQGPQQRGNLITFLAPAGDKYSHQQLIVIDPADRVMSVYHVNGESGQIALKCVRQIHWDLQIADFNGVSPLPREIRLMLEQK